MQHSNRTNSTGFLQWLNKNAWVLIFLAAFVYVMWGFIIGRNHFSHGFYQIHSIFENAYRGLDKNFSIPLWFPLFQGGKAAFGDMAFAYSPFGIDFILTYVTGKILGLDRLLGLELLDSWRILLMNVLFAFGCRQLARQILISRHSVDFVFLISLFIGGVYIAYLPMVVMCNVFAPWALLYITRIVTGSSDRFLHAVAGLTLTLIAGVFHQFNVQSLVIWPYILLYVMALLICGFGGNLLQNLRVQWCALKTRAMFALLMVAIIVSALPLKWEYGYYKENQSRIYSIDNSVYNRQVPIESQPHVWWNPLNWPNPMVLLFPYTNALERDKFVDDDFSGRFFFRTQYFGMLAMILMAMGLLAGKNRFYYAILLAVVVYLVLSLFVPSPVFKMSFKENLELPNIQFALLHLTPLLALFAGMGMDRMLGANETSSADANANRPTSVRMLVGFVSSWDKSRKTIQDFVLLLFKPNEEFNLSRVIKVLLVAIVIVATLVMLMMDNRNFATEKQGDLFSIAFMILSVLGLFWSMEITEAGGRFRLYAIIMLLDLFMFHNMHQRLTSGAIQDLQFPEETKYLRKNIAVPELAMLDNYSQFSPISPQAYDQPSQTLYSSMTRYPMIGNKLSGETKRFTSVLRDKIYGHALPRIYTAEYAIEDINGIFASEVLVKPQASGIVEQVVFLNDRPVTERAKLVSYRALKYFEDESKVNVENLMTFHQVERSMLSMSFVKKEKLPAKLFSGESLIGPSTDKLFDTEDKGWIQIDFGKEQTVNVLFANKDSSVFKRSAVLLASNDAISWVRVDFISASEVPEGGTSLPLNEMSHRYYRIAVEKGAPAIAVGEMQQLRLGHFKRQLKSDMSRHFHVEVPLLRFANEGLSANKRYYVFSYYLPRSEGVDFTTAPSQLFGYQYKLKWVESEDDHELQPTWHNRWDGDNLFQLSYKVDGRLSINIPAEKVIDYRKRILAVDIQAPNNGVRVLHHGADRLGVLVNQSNPAWLYFADTWDKYWQATSDGKKIPVYRANVQFKSVYLPEGRHTVEFVYKPESFSRLITLSYLVQVLAFAIWFVTRRKMPNPVGKQG